LKALSIMQPWPDAILFLGKDIENRSWSTYHRGPLVIHASRGWDPKGEQFIRGLLFKGETLVDRDRRLDVRDADDWMKRSRARRGAFLGLCWIVDVVECDERLQQLNRWAFGPRCWLLGDGHQFPGPRAFKTPVPGLGRLQLFDTEIKEDHE